jgi:O-antigen/teichoic acid export membrane protein
VYYLIIGKFFSAKELGYYTRADQFNALPSQSLTGVIGRVSYPILSSIQDDANRLKASYQQLIRSTMFITFTLMVGMAAVAEPMVVGLIGEKWKPSIIYLQMLCFTGMLYPLHALNLNMLQVKGRSDLFLRLEVIKKILAVPVIVIGIFWGIRVMIAGMMLNSVIALYINSYWSGRMIGYPFRQQISDILPSFSLSLAMAISVYLLGLILTYAPILNLLIQVTAGAAFILVFSEMAKFKDYLFIKEIVMERLHLKR